MEQEGCSYARLHDECRAAQGQAVTKSCYYFRGHLPIDPSFFQTTSQCCPSSAISSAIFLPLSVRSLFSA